MKYIYMLSNGSNPKLFATNFKVLHDTLKTNAKELGLTKIRNYQLLVRLARKGITLTFESEYYSHYIIKRIPLINKIAHLEEITANLY